MNHERAPRRATYAVLGDPVTHSLSPAMHSAAFHAAGRRARYVARRVNADECGAVLRALALDGGGGNVTVPHKERVLPFLDRRSPAVAATGACNTFWSERGEVWGDNTDVAGFLATWESSVSESVDRRVALVLGAGGAARAVVFALLQESLASRILLWNRSAGRAAALAGHFGDGRVVPVSECAGLSPNVIVNATSAGLHGRGTPLDLSTLRTTPAHLIDLVYGNDPTPLCRQARSLGVAAIDGREMLVRQAEAAYSRWFGEPPPKGVMAGAIGWGRR